MSPRIPTGVRRLFRLPMSAAQLRRDLDDEIRFHLEMRIEELVKRGRSREDAEREAAAQFGDPGDLREYCERLDRRRVRASGISEWARELAQDVAFGLRQLRRAPGFATTAILVTALGIGANTAMFSVVHKLILAPLPFADADRMVSLVATSNGGRFMVTPTHRMVDAWSSGRTVERVLPIADDYRVTVGDTAADSPDKAMVVATHPGLLDYLHQRPLIGRDLVPADTLAAAPPVALISEPRWRRDFGAEPTALGRPILLNGVRHTIVGVLPSGFMYPFEQFGVRADPVVTSLRHSSSDDRAYGAIAKLRVGITAEQADRELRTFFPDEPPRVDRAVAVIGAEYQRIVLMLFGAVGLVLLIACANVANLLMARAWARQREFAVRLALGAGRWRLIRQVLTESLTLSLAAGAVGAALAATALHLIAISQSATRPELSGVGLEPAVLCWTLGISIGTGVLFGLMPAAVASEPGISSSLKSSTRSFAGIGRSRRLRSGLVMMEIALSVALVASAGLLIRSIVAIQRFDVGFQPRGLFGVPFALRGARYATADAKRAFATELLDRIRATPGIEGASLAMALPPDNASYTGTYSIEGVSAAGDSMPQVVMQDVTPDFFKVAGLPLMAGRVFSPTTSVSDRFDADEVMISESFAKRFWLGSSPLGARIHIAGASPRIVGVVPDVRPPAMSWVDRRLQLYSPRSWGEASGTLIVRSKLPLATIASAVRALTKEIDPSLKLRRPAISAEDAIARYSAFHRFVLGILGSFAFAALVLAAIGVYGVISYSVTQRTREMGVRIALGAQAADVVGLVLGEGARVTIAGVVIGTAIALVATRGLRDLLWEVGPTDPVALGLAAIVLGATALVASYVPARRAASVDPLEALRAE